MPRRYYVPGTKPASPFTTTVLALGAYWLLREAYGRYREQELLGHVALVTGASRGFGYLIAKELGHAGCKLVICSRDQAELDRAVGELETAGVETLAVRCDVTNKDDVAAMIEAANNRFGQVDLLVNNAGEIEVGPVTEMARDDFEQAMNVMYWGVLNTILAVLPQMRERRGGRIANVTSIGGKVAIPHLIPYSSAKFAAVGLSEGLSAELKAEGITVTTIVPGLLRTGSYLHAEFKGLQEREATWFTLSDNIPGLAMSPETAAKQVVRAIKRGEAEVVLSLPAKVLTLANGVFPGVVNFVSTLVNQIVLPPDPGGANRMMTGEEVRQQMRNKHAPNEPVLEMGDKQVKQYLEEPAGQNSGR